MEPIAATISHGLLTMPNGKTFDLTKIQAACNAGFQEMGDHDLMTASDTLAEITGLTQGPSGEFIMSADMPAELCALADAISAIAQGRLYFEPALHTAKKLLEGFQLKSPGKRITAGLAAIELALQGADYNSMDLQSVSVGLVLTAEGHAFDGSTYPWPKQVKTTCSG